MKTPEADTKDNTTIRTILEAAPMATLLHIAQSSDAQRFVRELAEETQLFELEAGHRKRRVKSQDQLSYHLTVGAFAADLILHSGNEDAQGFCYHSSRRGTFSDTVATDRHFENLKTTWPQMGLVEIKRGFLIREDFDGEMAPTGQKNAGRYRATPELLRRAAAFGISPNTIDDQFRKHRANDFPIKLKARKKRYSECDKERDRRLYVRRDKRVSKLAADVREINEFLDQCKFNLPTPPQLTRIFNCGDDPDFRWNKGGRLYSQGKDGFQTLKKAQRSEITINGERTVELDVKASHLTIFYGLNDMDLPDRRDPYAPGNLPRFLVKKFVVTAFGRGSFPKRWPNGTWKAYEEETGNKKDPAFNVQAIMSHVLDHHPIMKRLEGSGYDWSDFQFLEAEIFLSVMLKLQRSFNVPSLPMHDSLIVPASYDGETFDLLSDEYQRQVGITPIIEPDLSGDF